LERWLTIGLFSLTVFFVGAVSVGFYTQLRNAVLDRTEAQLLSINILKKRLVEQYLNNQVREGKELLLSLIGQEIALTNSNFLLQADNHDWQAAYFLDSAGTRLSSGETIPLWVDSIWQHTQSSPFTIDIFNRNSRAKGEFYIALRTDQASLLLSYNVSGLETIVTERTGMGATGESYLVTETGQMLTASRFFPDKVPGQILVDTEGFRAAKIGGEGVKIYPDYREVPIVGAYRQIQIPNNPWVILTEIDVAEAIAPITMLRNRFWGLSLLFLLLSWLISTWLAKGLSQPILSLKRSINSLARGKLPKHQIQNSRIREIGNIAESLNELIQALNSTANFAQRIGQGDFRATYHPLSDQDKLGHSLLTMRDQLILLNDQKEQLERETKKVLVSTQEAERERISRDIHDGIGPLLTATKFKMSSSEIPASTRKEIIQLLDDIIAEIRRISSNLMPAVLSDFGPGEALNQLVREIRENTNLTVRYVNDLLTESRLNKEAGIALYRIAQEAINNTLKHADATEITMSLTEFDDLVIFYYKDNGKGFDFQKVYRTRGKGLKNIQERIGILGGVVRIHSNDGTTIEAEIPVV
jgi:signal transduction histidine kinase